MLDLVFLVLMLIILFKANRGEVNNTLCDVALVIGILAGILGLVQAFFLKGSSFWTLNIVVMLFAFLLKRTAMHFAKLYNKKIEEAEEQYRKHQEHYAHNNSRIGFTEKDYDFDDPDVRFGGGNGKNWNGK